MKRNLTLAVAALLFIGISSCTKGECECEAPKETTIVLQNEIGDVFDAHLDFKQSSPGNANSNTGSLNELATYSWTVSGDPVTGRCLVGFSLQSIPAGSEILSAKLSLYGWPDNFPSVHITQGNSGDNVLLLQRVTSAWDENTVTWNTQPSITSEGQIELPPSTSTWGYDIMDIDVTNLVKQMVAGTNYGFSLRLKTEATYRSIGFMSSEYEVPAKRPKLEITYRK